jgi:hypothetical protein
MITNRTLLAYFVAAPTIAVAARYFIGGPMGAIDVLAVVAITAVSSLVFAAFVPAVGLTAASRVAGGAINQTGSASAPSWDVFINDVQVGTVTEAHYRAMRGQVRRDLRNAGVQILNVFEIVAGLVRRVALGVPFAFFWLVLGTLALSPEPGEAALRRFLDNPPSAAALCLIAAAGLTFLGIVLSALSGDWFGFENHYTIAVAKLLRQHCNSPAQGDVRLTRDVSFPPSNDAQERQTLA